MVCEERWRRTANDLTLVRVELEDLAEKLTGNGKPGITERLTRLEEQKAHLEAQVKSMAEQQTYWGRRIVGGALSILVALVINSLLLVWNMKAENKVAHAAMGRNDSGQSQDGPPLRPPGF